jgi:hypothetical protein
MRLIVTVSVGVTLVLEITGGALESKDTDCTPGHVWGYGSNRRWVDHCLPAG